MRSAWGPHHLPITMIYRGRSGGQKGEKNCGSNLSPDRLDSSKPYTIQNLIFIRNDENSRKKKYYLRRLSSTDKITRGTVY